MTIERLIDRLPRMSQEDRRRLRANAERQAQTGAGAMHQDAQRLLKALDRLHRDEHEAVVARLSGLEGTERVIEAFRLVPLSEAEERVTIVLLENPWTTAYRLSELMGWDAGGWQLHFGKMCREREQYLEPAEYAESLGAPFYCGILCDTKTENGEFKFRLKPAATEAFLAMGLWSAN